MNLLLDYDGTLHDSTAIYAPAFREAYAYLISRGFASPRSFTDEEISRFTGYSADDMWAAFMPELPKNERDHCSRMIGDNETRLIAGGAARLYPGAEDALRELRSEGHTLLLLSNCGQDYMDAHARFFGLDAYFAALYCGEAFGYAPKREIFHTICQNHPGGFIVIGDRFHDMEIARTHGLRSIGCAYGYGGTDELCGADVIISAVTEMPEAVRTLLLKNS